MLYKLKVKDTVFTCPKESIVALALSKAMEKGIFFGNIHDDKTALQYLETIGITEVTE